MNQEKFFIVYKNLGETPLEALERTRLNKGLDPLLPMTYAGRLDPMAEGVLLVLVGDECKNKQKYLDMPKEYETEILFGIETDTFDILGLPKITEDVVFSKDCLLEKIDKYIGKSTQVYPSFSSKTVSGKPLFQYFREGEDVALPKREVEVFSIDFLEERNLSSDFLLQQIEERISKVKGDFRQSEILLAWNKILAEKREFKIIKLKINCGSGFYVRRFADSLGKEFGMGAIAYSIKRTKVGNFSI